MQFFAIASLLAIATSAFAATVPESPVSITELESTIVDGTALLEKRVGTEVVTCYNSGARADRAPITSSIDNFCSRNIGKTINNGQTISVTYNYGTVDIVVSAAAINGCSFVVDGNCNRLLRKPVDECNTSGENGKQGGYVTDVCGQWRLDPNSK